MAAKKPELARAWIYARLIIFLIAERSAGQVPDSAARIVERGISALETVLPCGVLFDSAHSP
ncbi:hypothetical protein RFM99_19870 [Mesorhizobium sp. VK4C]|uniref:hypothetical protein n=1 Tax=Mesorhizobium captivum TaxID=3072319 RepID=UPI002A242609|nr:hypothetical protein [Mesorhizobium sp. VK4C]MDX8500666.1 hypothetical protein [Mesorhizobium sp. VK4C]